LIWSSVSIADVDVAECIHQRPVPSADGASPRCEGRAPVVFLVVLACAVRPARVARKHPGSRSDPDLFPGPGAGTACLLGGPVGGGSGRVALCDLAIRLACVNRRHVLLLLPVSGPAHAGCVGLVWMAKPDLHALADPIERRRLLDF